MKGQHHTSSLSSQDKNNNRLNEQNVRTMKLAQKRTITAILLLLVVSIFAAQVFGEPSGTTISNNLTETGPTTAPDSHTANRSTITTMVLTAVQQNQQWKAYVGNVTGSLTLDDADGNTIYDWSLATTTITGEVYASRSGTLDFSATACADTATLDSENTFHNMTAGQVDNINGTFNSTLHSSFVVAGSTINADTCSAQATFVNDARQAPGPSADFQQVLLEDNTNNLVYVALLNDNTVGFDGDSYDFQMIVAESDVKPVPTTYFFYVELG